MPYWLPCSNLETLHTPSSMHTTLKINQLTIILLSTAIFLQCRTNENKELPLSSQFSTDSTIQIIQSFPPEVEESSGIIFLEDKIWTHNDSGDEPKLYQISIEKGELLKEIWVENATARDWEDIAQDSHFVYLGDFGNNAGRRQDLAIYKIKRADILANTKRVESFKINFTYPDRTDFYPLPYKHNFDCEAFIAIEDSIYVFSKNHVDNHTRLYSLSNNLSQQTANLKARFDTKGLVTGAGIDKENRILALVGYFFNDGFDPFVWFFWDYPENNFFSGKSKRVNLPFLVQSEGICYWKDGKFLISTEKSRTMRGKLMVVDGGKVIRSN